MRTDDVPGRYRLDLDDGFETFRDPEGIEADSAGQALEQGRAMIEAMRDDGGIRRIRR